MRITIVTFMFLVIVFSNCKDPFQFNISRSTGTLVVNGGVSDLPGPLYLSLGTSSQIARQPDPLSGARVTLIDENGNREDYLDIGEGKYQFNGKSINVQKNHGYLLEIILPNGQRYRSTSETVPSFQAADSVYYKIVKEKVITSEGYLVDNTNVQIYLNSVLPKTDSQVYLRWGVDEVYCIIPTCRPGAIACPAWCYIYQPISKFNLKVIDNSSFSEPALSDVLLQSRAVDYTFLVRHYFNVTQYAMNLNAYNYWKKVELLTERNGSIFDTPPANVTGNIYNVNDPAEKVFGFFEASAGRLTRVFIDRGYIPIDITSCDWSYLIPNGNYYSYCLNCGAIPGSTHTPPSWFF